MSQSAEGAVIPHQELPTPDGAIRTEARAVERHADHRLIEIILRHATGHVGVMMLDADRWTRPSVLRAYRGRLIIGMQIVDQELRPQVEKSLIMRDRLGVGAEGLVVIEIADVMAEEGMTSPAHRERRLQLATQGQRRPAALDRQRNRSWRIAPRAANRQLNPGDDPRHRVVASQVNRPVMHEEEIGDACQAFERIAILIGDRLVGSIAAGHHQGNAVQLAQEQVMQGSIGQHHAQPRVSRRDALGHACVGLPSQQHDGPSGREEQRFLRGRDLTDLADRGDILPPSARMASHRGASACATPPPPAPGPGPQTPPLARRHRPGGSRPVP